MNPTDTPDDFPSHIDREAFFDACYAMQQDDWDADNEWLASAGWGEM